MNRSEKEAQRHVQEKEYLRAERLLKRHLTPAQKVSWKKHKFIRVTGSKRGVFTIRGSGAPRTLRPRLYITEHSCSVYNYQPCSRGTVFRHRMPLPDKVLAIKVWIEEDQISFENGTCRTYASDQEQVRIGLKD